MRMERKSPKDCHGHSVSLCVNLVVGASQDSCVDPGPSMKPRYFPDVVHVYLGSSALPGSSMRSLMSCSGSSHRGMFFVFFMLTSIVVTAL